MAKRRVDSQIGNLIRPNFLAFRWRVTYHWKVLNESYNFASNLISIKGLHTKLWAPKFKGIQVIRISRPPFGSPGTKWHLGVGPMTKHRVYYKGEGGDFPQIWIMVSLVSPCLHVARLCIKVLQLCTNQLVVSFLQVHVSDWIAYQSKP
jgi:hypothetical protein